MFGVNAASSPEGNQSRLKKIRRCDPNNLCQKDLDIEWWADANGIDAENYAYDLTVPADTTTVYKHQDLSNPRMVNARWHDFNGDGRPDYIYTQKNGTNPASQTASGTYTLMLSDINNPGIYNNATWTTPGISQYDNFDEIAFADVNGDGRTDLVVPEGVTSSGVANFKVALASSNNFSVQTWQGFSHAGDESEWFLYDMDGDKALDLVTLVKTITSVTPYSCGIFGTHNLHEYDIEVLVHTNSGTNFSSAQSWLTGLKDEVQLADMNGDGYMDVIEKTRYVYFNNASGFDPKLNSGSSGGYTPCWGGIYWAKFFDFNKDGLADRYEGTSVDYFTGESFVSAGASFAMLPFVEENGDTKADSYGRSESGSGPTKESAVSLLFMRDEMGAHSEAEALLDDEDLYGFQQSVDLDGDGISEYTAVLMDNCQTSTPYGYCETNTIRVYGNDDPPHHLIRKITTGFGLETEFTFKQIADPSVYTKGTSGVLPVEDVKEGLNVVSTFKRSDGIGGYVTIDYFYEDLKRDHGGRGLLGFAEITSKNLTTELTTITEYEQTFPYASQPKRVEVRRTSDNRLLQSSDTTYQVIGTVGQGPVFAYVDTVVEKRWGLNTGDHLSTTTTTNVVDTYGNIDSSTVLVEDHINSSNHQVQTTADYSSDTVNWWLHQRDWTLTKHWKNGVPDPNLDKHLAYDYYSTTGLLKETTQEDGQGTDVELTTELEYDQWGNVDKQIISGPGITTRTSETTWEPIYGRFPVIRMNPLQHTETLAWNAKFGVMTSQTDPNMLQTTWVHDPFGSVELETRPDQTTTETKYYEDNGSGISKSVMYSEVVTTGAPRGRTFSDKLGRTLRARSQSFSGAYVNVDTEYNAKGQVEKTSEPYFDNDTPHWNERFYDLLGRQNGYSGADPTQNYLKAFSNFEITNYLPGSRVSKTTSNALGQLILTEDYAQSQTKFEYDAAGNREKVINAWNTALQNSVEYDYDQLGRLTAQNDPDHGVYSYKYNALGEKREEVSPKMAAASQKREFFYDVMGRMTSRVEPEGTTTWTYDDTTAGNLGVGKVHQESQSGFLKEYRYSSTEYGRLTSTITTIGASPPYTTSWAYNSLGKVESETYPSGFVAISTHNPLGFLERVQDSTGSKVFYQLVDTDATGRVTEEWKGDGSTKVVTFDGQSSRIDEQHTTNTFGDVQHFEYGYDTIGSMLTREDHVTSQTETFTYDIMDRLKTAQVTGEPVVNYGFNAIGNMTTKSDLGTSLAYTATQPHALNEISNSGTTDYINYDDNGNLEDGDDVPTITWSSYNKPTQLSKSGSTYTFEYGPDRKRYKKDENGDVTHYVGMNYEKIFLSGGNWGERHYVRANGKVVMLRSTYLNWPAHEYIHRDHLDSVTAKTQESGGAVVERYSYDAWGKRRDAIDWSQSSPTTTEIRGYTGHEHLDDIEVIHMNGRVYAPKLGRMLSPDPITQAPDVGQVYNRFSYANNNPLRFVDPSGFTFAPTYPQQPIPGYFGGSTFGYFFGSGGIGMNLDYYFYEHQLSRVFQAYMHPDTPARTKDFIFDTYLLFYSTGDESSGAGDAIGRDFAVGSVTFVVESKGLDRFQNIFQSYHVGGYYDSILDEIDLDYEVRIQTDNLPEGVPARYSVGGLLRIDVDQISEWSRGEQASIIGHELIHVRDDINGDLTDIGDQLRSEWRAYTWQTQNFDQFSTSSEFQKIITSQKQRFFDCFSGALPASSCSPKPEVD